MLRAMLADSFGGALLEHFEPRWTFADYEKCWSGGYVSLLQAAFKWEISTSPSTNWNPLKEKQNLIKVDFFLIAK